jgi:hypothetical protein
MPLNRTAVIIIFLMGLAMMVGCKPDDREARDAQERHRAAMKDFGKSDEVHVRSPWGDALEGRK